VNNTCIHVSSMCRSGEVSGEEIAGGNGWINLGTTTRSLPKTKIAPALFAVPITQPTIKRQNLERRIIFRGKCNGESPEQWRINKYHSSLSQKKVWSNVPEQNAQSHPSHIHVPEQSAEDHCCCKIPWPDQAATVRPI